METRPKRQTSQKKPEIPVIWDTACRDIPICSAMMGGIQRMANKKRYAVKVYGSCAELAANPHANRTVIVLGFESSRFLTVLQELQALGKRIVVTSMDADHIDSHYSCATFSRRIATEQMLDYLLGKGCRRIALVGCGERSVNDTVHSDAMEKYLSKRHQEAFGQTFWYYTRIAESFQEFLAHRPAFDAVLCPNDFAAVAFLHFCEEQGLRVPEDLLLATIKGSCVSQYCKPSITSLSVDFDSIGVHSVSTWLFLQDIEDDSLQVRLTIPGEIAVRESTGLDTPQTAQFAPLPLDGSYQGGPFYGEPTLQALMRIERCLQGCDELDLRIIGRLVTPDSYEKIAESLFLCESSLQYRVHNIFQRVQVNDRRMFVKLLQENFTRSNHFQDA